MLRSYSPRNRPLARFMISISAAIGTALPVHAQVMAPAVPHNTLSTDALRHEIGEQSIRLESMQRELTLQRARLNTLLDALGNENLQQRGRGTSNATDSGSGGMPQPALVQSAPAVSPDDGVTAPVGIAPQSKPREPQVASIFEQPGVLTQKGHYVLEPSIQYGYSSNNRIALVGYTVIPALLIGLVDVREVKRNTLTAAVAGRIGITNRFEIEARIPYVYRSDATVSREIFTGSATDRVFNTSGRALGDIELGTRYQFNDGGVEKPYFIGTLRFKSRTGRDPFGVVTDCATRCIGNTTGTGLPLDLPTGTGFYSLQPGLTWLFPTDPAVFFGSFSYTRNFTRNNVSRTVLNGEHEFLGSVKPGDVLGTNFGLGLALNDKSSFSVGVDLNSIARTRQNGIAVAGSVRTQLATLLLGYSYRLSDRSSMSVAIGAGLTRDTPDLTLNFKLPMSF